LSMYVWCVIPLALATWADFVPVYVAVIWMLASFGGNAAFYFMFRSGYNKRFKDPSLTLPQMWLGIIIVLFTQIFAGPLRGGFLMPLILIFIVGCFKLRTNQMLWLTAASSLLYAATFPLTAIIEGPAFDWAQTLILWSI